MGYEKLYGWNLFHRGTDFLPALVLLIPLIFVFPMILSNKVFGVFVAEPVSNILAASVTAFMLFSRLNRILDQGVKV